MICKKLEFPQESHVWRREMLKPHASQREDLSPRKEILCNSEKLSDHLAGDTRADVVIVNDGWDHTFTRSI